MTTRPSPYAKLPRVFNAATHFVDRHVLEGRGSRVALICEDREVTYTEVQANVDRCGHALRRLGVRMEDRVALLLLDSPEFVYSFWGAIKIGAVPVPVNTLLRPRDYEYPLNDSRAKTVIVSEALAGAIEEIRPRLRFLEHVVVAGRAVAPQQIAFDTLIAGERAELTPAETTKDDAAFWLYTSGTTGVPKAAVHLQHDMVVCCEALGQHVLGIGEHDRCFSVAKLFFAYGLGNALYYPFYVGASSVLHPGRFEPARVFEIIARHRPTLFFAVPTAYAALLQLSDATRLYDLRSLRFCLSAGEPLPPVLYERWRERFGVEILDGIGSTEMCNTFIANRPGQVRPGSSGVIVPGYEARIVDDDDHSLPDDAVGNLMVKGDSACAYYWNQHERTKATILGDWVRTGDKYSRDGDGYFWYAGRSDDMLKVSGMWVSPTEIENALLEHEAVREAAVVGTADADQLTKPLAFVVPSASSAPGLALEQEIQEFVKAKLAPYKYPRWVVFVPELPKTATGKIQRYKLRDMALRLGRGVSG
ncbi:MAG: benzoate-CoA ligase family protein [Chloroflexota bacterium]|nr:benzoate-CoA ligase family protein [Chloroflexota bacterium]